jgi:ABC-type Fe3+/spermidine/putrescine transport system ATPase subunit
VNDPVLSCSSLTVQYGDTVALDGLDVTVGPGELLAVLGPSGSGKTTLLNAVAGFLPVVAGSITISGQLVADRTLTVPPEDRNVGVVFQHHALWPHLTALETAAFPLRGRAGAREQARDLLDRLGVGHLADRRPDELSGGEQQRVSLARALARRPALFLLDEPTAHLDAPLRASLLEEIGRQRSRAEAATLYATHDAAEAMALADRLLLLRAGRVVQVGPARQVYEEPVDRWAAALTGPASVLDIELIASPPGRVRLALNGAEREIDVTGVGRLPLIRPEWARLGGPFRARVEHIAYRGPRTEYRLATGAGPLLVSESGPPTLEIGAETGWDVGRAHLVSRR